MKLRTRWTANEIRSRLPGEGGVGFLFHATDPETLSFAFEGRSFTDEELWVHGPFIGGPIFYKDCLVGCHIISPVPASLWAGSHSGVRKFRQLGYNPSLKLAGACGLSHVGLGALIPFETQFGRYSERLPDLRLTTGHAATVANLGHMVAAIAGIANIEPKTWSYAIFGAAGSIGSTSRGGSRGSAGETYV